MKADLLAIAGSFCWNQNCSGYGKVNCGTLAKYAQTAKGGGLLNLCYGLLHSYCHHKLTHCPDMIG